MEVNTFRLFQNQMSILVRASDPLIFNLQIVRMFTVKFDQSSFYIFFCCCSHHWWKFFCSNSRAKNCTLPRDTLSRVTNTWLAPSCVSRYWYISCTISISHTSPLFRTLRFTQNNTIIKTDRSSLVLLKHFFGKKGERTVQSCHWLKKKKRAKGRTSQSNNRCWRTHRLHYQSMCKRVMKMWESRALESSRVPCHSSGNTGATFRKYKRSSL